MTPRALSGAWALRTPVATPPVVWTTAATSIAITCEDAEAVTPRPWACPPAAPYAIPARRLNATLAILAGRTMPLPALPEASTQAQSAQQPAAYVPPHRRSAEEQAVAAASARPGRLCPFPSLLAGPMPEQPAAAPLPLYRLALLG